VDLRDLPLDARDQELLAKVRGETSITDLVAGTAWDATDSARRIHRLMQLGLVERVQRPMPESGVMPRASVPDPDDAITLKPTKPLPIDKMFEETATRPVEIRTPRGAITLDAAIAHDRGVFSRVTLIDEDPTARLEDADTPYAEKRRAR
jgi:hypothetical protein